MSSVLIKEDKLKALVLTKLTRAGLDDNTAREVTDVLVHADMTGVHSHGVIRVEHYCTRLQAGGVKSGCRDGIPVDFTFCRRVGFR